MTGEELERVRRLMAEAMTASANRSVEFHTSYADLVVEISAYWRSLAPDGASLPPELVAKIDEFKRRHFD